MDFEKLKRDEEAVEAMYKPTSDPVVAPSYEDQFNTEDLEENESTETEVITQIVDNEEEEKSSWKYRFTNYKASTDITIRDLRKDNAKMRVTLGDRERELSQVRSELTRAKESLNVEDPFKGVFNENDEELIGKEALDIIKKATLANKRGADPQVEALKIELAKIREEQRVKDLKAVKDLEDSSITDLKTKLATVVPNWSDIDTEPAFSSYLQEVDPVSGKTRMTFFIHAIKNEDVVRVADFYKDYNSRKPKSREEILSRKVGVSGSGASESTTDGRDLQKRVYSIDEYTTAMDAINKGKYDRKTAKLIEKRFDIAFQEGRVR